MRLPSWVYAVAITMLLVGGCGSLQRASSLILMSPEVVGGIKELSKKDLKNSSPEDRKAIERLGIDKMLEDDNLLATTNSNIWLALGASVLYLITGIFFLLKKRFTLKLFYFTIFVSMILAITAFEKVSDIDYALAYIGAIVEVSIALVIDVVLLLIVALSDKTEWKYLTGEFNPNDESKHSFQK